MPETDPLMTQKDVAGYLKLSVQTLNGWRHHKRYGFDKVPIVPFGNKIRYRKSEIDKFIKDRER